MIRPMSDTKDPRASFVVVLFCLFFFSWLQLHQFVVGLSELLFHDVAEFRFAES